ncbi:CDP-alcohol phosphatidyltransferase family protein [Patescibacteria group bacterium]|nr:MAG: CDP-alcohol phosphatidyltransferase family protein [Patescibacteria group bacterium]
MALFFDEAVRRPLLDYVPHWIKPNHLSLGRVVLVLPLIFWREKPAAAVAVVIISGVLDLLDGPLARARGEVSRFGAFLDATADKAFVWSALFFACREVFPAWLVWGVVAVDAALFAIRPVKLARRLSVNATVWSKVKLWLQMIALGLALTRNEWLVTPAAGVLGIALYTAAISLAAHLRDLFRKRA